MSIAVLSFPVYFQGLLIKLCTIISREGRARAQKHYVKSELLPRMQMQIDVIQGVIFAPCRGANGRNIPSILSKEWDWSNNLIHQIVDKKFKNNGKTHQLFRLQESLCMIQLYKKYCATAPVNLVHKTYSTVRTFYHVPQDMCCQRNYITQEMFICHKF